MFIAERGMTMGNYIKKELSRKEKEVWRIGENLCGFLVKNKFGRSGRFWVRRRALGKLLSIDPLPPEASGSIDLARNSRQNPDVKELRY